MFVPAHFPLLVTVGSEQGTKKVQTERDGVGVWVKAHIAQPEGLGE